jgi:hypothetical protein
LGQVRGQKNVSGSSGPDLAGEIARSAERELNGDPSFPLKTPTDLLQGVCGAGGSKNENRLWMRIAFGA